MRLAFNEWRDQAFARKTANMSRLSQGKKFAISLPEHLHEMSHNYAEFCEMCHVWPNLASTSTIAGLLPHYSPTEGQ